MILRALPFLFVYLHRALPQICAMPGMGPFDFGHAGGGLLLYKFAVCNSLIRNRLDF